MDIKSLESWLKNRQKRKKEEMNKNVQSVGLPNGLTIHVNIDNKSTDGIKLPMTPDGKALATRDAVARYPG